MTDDVINVITGGADDLFRVMPIMERAFLPEFGEAWNMAQCLSMLALSGTTLLLCLYEKQVCGFAISRQVLDEAELLLFAVDPDYRRLGAGSKLLQVFENKSKNMGVKSLFLEVRSGNPAQQLYHKAGFAQIGKRPAYYKGASGNVFDAVTYKKNCH